MGHRKKPKICKISTIFRKKYFKNVEYLIQQKGTERQSLNEKKILSVESRDHVSLGSPQNLKLLFFLAWFLKWCIGVQFLQLADISSLDYLKNVELKRNFKKLPVPKDGNFLKKPYFFLRRTICFIIETFAYLILYCKLDWIL